MPMPGPKAIEFRESRVMNLNKTSLRGRLGIWTSSLECQFGYVKNNLKSQTGRNGCHHKRALLLMAN